MKIAENIRTIRNAKQIKQNVIADALDIDVAAVSNMENGKREIKVSELDTIAGALGVSIVDLITYPDRYAPIANAESKKEPLKAILQIELSPEKRDQIFHLVFGENELKILNK